MSTHIKDPEKDIVPATTTTVVDSHAHADGDGDYDGHPEKHLVRVAEADEAARFVAGFGREVTPEEGARVRRKIDWNLLPLMMILYFIQFTDKTTLNAANIMGLRTDTGISQSQYNWLTTAFYLAYLVFEWPQTLGLQRFPAGKWMAGNILIWGVALCCMAACKNFAGLLVCRIILGACEGSITAGFLIVTSMFYTHSEATRRVGYWFLMNGTALIFNGLSAFGVYHVNHDIISPWKVYMILTGGMTLVVGVAFWIWIPDSPMTARFLSTEEKMIALERLRGQSTGVENKVWKREQFIEALTDWKPWAFALYACLNNFGNSLINMTALIINSFGFTVQQTTLLGCVSGVIEIITIYSSVLVIKRYPNSRAIVGACYSIPTIIGGILLIAVPYHLKGVLLFGMYITGVGIPGFVLALSWCAASNTGHTKKTTTNAMLLIGYCVGNLVSPQIWQAKYAPRYCVPWAVILTTWVINPFILLTIRHFLKKENTRRDKLTADPDYVPERYFDEQGQEIDQTFMDITDRKNMAFRYPL